MKLDRWTVIVGSLFGAVFAVNALLLTVARHSHQGMLDEHPYRQGLEFDTIQSEAQRFLHSGWKATLSPSPIRVELIDARDTPVHGLKISLRAIRPNSSALDVSTSLVEQTPGKYSAAQNLPDGRWMLELLIQTPQAERFRLSRQIWIERGELVSLNN